MKTFKQLLESLTDSFASHLQNVKYAMKDAADAYSTHGNGHPETKKAHDKYVGAVKKLYASHGKYLPKDEYDFHDEFGIHTDINSYVKSKTK